MNRNTLVQGIIALIIGAIGGFFFGMSTQEVWFGAIVGIVVCISVFGLESFFNVLFPMSPSSRSGWHLLLAVLLVVLIGTPQASGVVRTSSLYGTILLLMGVLISGATIGIGIARRSSFEGENT